MMVARMGGAVLLSLSGLVVGVGAALARDERRAERISGDDDPILMPRSSQPGALDVAALDSDTTGSVEKPTRRSRSRCNMLAWFPDRPPGQEYEETC